MNDPRDEPYDVHLLKKIIDVHTRKHVLLQSGVLGRTVF